jgi:hypothetical protein
MDSLTDDGGADRNDTSDTGGTDTTDTGGMDATETDEPGDGWVTVRGALGGLVLLWLSAMSGFGALQAAVYGARVNLLYLLVAVGAASLSALAAYGSLRSFGVR